MIARAWLTKGSAAFSTSAAAAFLVAALLPAGGCRTRPLTAVDAGVLDAPAAPRLLTDGLVASVSSDQLYLAFYRNASIDPNAGPMGELWLEQLADGEAVGTPVKLADNAFAADFNLSGDVLLFQTGPTPSIEPGVSDVYGVLHVWQPNLDAPVRMTQGLCLGRAEAPDNSSVMFSDAPMPTRVSSGAVMLVRTAQCIGGDCVSTALMDNLSAKLIYSGDGTHGLIETGAIRRNTSFIDVYLVDISDGKVRQIAESNNAAMHHPLIYANQMAFSPDGTKVATITNPPAPNAAGRPPLQLKVVSTATGDEIPWGTQPPGTQVEELGFLDDDTLFLFLDDPADEDLGVFRSTASSFELYDGKATAFGIGAGPDGEGHFIFTTHTNVASSLDLTLHLPGAPASDGVVIAAAATTFPAISSDLSHFLLTDGKGAPSGNALEYGTLPDGHTTVISTDPLGSAVFARGTNEAFFVEPSSPGRILKFYDGAVHEIDRGVTSFVLRKGPPPRLYFSIGVPDPASTSGRGQGIWSVPRP